MTKAKSYGSRKVGALLAALTLVAAILLSGCGGDEQPSRSGEFKANPGAGTYGIGF